MLLTEHVHQLLPCLLIVACYHADSGGHVQVRAQRVILEHDPDVAPVAGKVCDALAIDGDLAAVRQAKAAAGDDKFVGVGSPSIIQQLLDNREIDAIHVNLVPVLLGAGVPFFANLADTPVRLSDPEVVESTGVTHLTFTVLK